VQLIDANVLLHAVNERAREHDLARNWLIEALGGSEVVGLAWLVLLAFLRLSTHPAIFPRPLEVGQAASAMETWLGSPQAVLVEPTRRHLPLLRGLLVQSGTAGNLVGDAHLATLALEHDATVISFDRDFDRFEGVSWRLPS
jgi:toxin-antitoxin system PIN domain toxin